VVELVVVGGGRTVWLEADCLVSTAAGLCGLVQMLV